jgi:putative phosphoribosyl transferase
MRRRGEGEMRAQPIEIVSEAGALPGELVSSPEASGLVIFAHGSGSGARSPRNRYVAQTIQSQGLATMLFDLLTDAEQDIVSKRFNIGLLTQRLLAAITWAGREPAVSRLPIGLFGASTGAAAALRAAAILDGLIHGVVSRGGRTDLTGESISEIVAPTLLIVGALDEEVLALNRETFAALTCEKRLAVVPGATHLFEEEGTLREVATLASVWFKTHLRGAVGQQPTGAPLV